MTDPGASGMAKPLRLSVLLTCFNRCDKTLECLRAVAASTGLNGVQVQAVLVDDGSADGTADAVRRAFPWVQVVDNQGPALYWCRGMHRAFGLAMQQGADHYLLLNDDTLLFPDALAGMLDSAVTLGGRTSAPVIVVGSTQRFDAEVRSYGGERIHSRLRPTHCIPVDPCDIPQRIDTFNGNVVLIPADAARKLGNLDPVFEHALGDIDYGLRAKGAGVELWLAPGYQGQCSNNEVAGSFQDCDQPLRVRLKQVLSRKGLPWRSWLHFTRRHSGVAWPLYFAWPYVKVVLQSVRSGRIWR